MASGQKKKTTGKARQGGGQSRQTSRSPQKNPRPPIRREVGGGVCLLLALCVVVSYFQADAIVLNLLGDLLKGLTGYGYWLVAPALALAGVNLLAHRGRPVALRTVCTLVTPVLLGAILHLFLYQGETVTGLGPMMKSLWADGLLLKSGGAVAGGLAAGMKRLVGTMVSVIVLLLLLAAALLAALRVSPRELVQRARDRVPYEPQPEPERPARPERPRRQRPSVDVPLDDAPAPREKTADRRSEPPEEPLPRKKGKGFFARKGDEFARVLKMGRTQLQDAVPMTLGQTFHGFASVLRGEVDNLDHAAQEFLSINMGATAIGTGICAEPGYAERCTAAIREITGWDVTLAEDLVGATSDTVCMVGYSSAMKRIASKMNKICNDLRLLSSGPRCGLGEFNLPARQPGSSIMPGKVNPVIPEVMNQIAFKVIGNELCVTMADEAAQMELNAMEPVMAQCCFESAELLINGFDTLRIRCVDGITANEEKCLQYVRNSIGVVTALNPIIGYKNSTKIAKEALETGRGVYELVLEHGILNRDELDEVLRPENMIHPVKLDIKPRR